MSRSSSLKECVCVCSWLPFLAHVDFLYSPVVSICTKWRVWRKLRSGVHIVFVDFCSSGIWTFNRTIFRYRIFCALSIGMAINVLVLTWSLLFAGVYAVSTTRSTSGIASKAVWHDSHALWLGSAMSIACLAQCIVSQWMER